MPATMSPTSPLETIPMPTFIAFDLFLKYKIAGKPQPANLLTIATGETSPGSKQNLDVA